VNHGAAATFTVTPATGYSINQVTGCGGNLVGSTYTTGPVIAACSVEASFALTGHNVSVTAGAGGSVFPLSQTVNHGMTATFTLTPTTGYSIDQVTGCGGSLVGNTYTTGVISTACTVEARFALNSYSVTTAVSAGGRIFPASQTVEHGATATFTLERDDGFGITRITGCGGSRYGEFFTTGPVLGTCVVEAIFGEPILFGTHPINDTGIDWCADVANNYNVGDASYKTMQCDAVSWANPGQDGHYGRDALAREQELPKIGSGAAGFDFTKISNAGSELSNSATIGIGPNDWACTRDNVTGLTWEVKVNDPGHLRYHGHTYTWYLTGRGSQNGGLCLGSVCDTNGFVQAVNDQGLCGANDWRVPNLRELQGIAKYSRLGPAMDRTFFIHWGLTWSASEYAAELNKAWNINFNDGRANGGSDSVPRRVRLVRGQ
jgi:hypothetical protein